ncbi:hypothetical protein QIH93_14990 [Bradyrhizobium ottawaense]|uniref:hypothetical protein n=1 Tax=Bradyrhizobium ottawaense TaxID=931866 RepID=UPI002714E42E|nr:hypothetical protein [Bradyrhizobium ottawaense]WLB49218.1 hypothetical protein QIH93_14990 [Bradyrhizobium ottawaense]
MAKPQVVDTRPLGADHSWARTNGTYISGRAYIDGADETACEMEAKWGADRLRLLVPAELREKFDRQRYLLNQAIWHGELEDVRRETGRMVNAWLTLDRVATEAGKQPLPPAVWEIALGDGSVAAIVPDHARAAMVNAEGRQVAVYTLDEIARLLTNYPEVAKAKLVFPGAIVTEVRRTVSDPLSEFWDTKETLDDPIPDLG